MWVTILLIADTDTTLMCARTCMMKAKLAWHQLLFRLCTTTQDTKKVQLCFEKETEQDIILMTLISS